MYGKNIDETGFGRELMMICYGGITVLIGATKADASQQGSPACLNVVHEYGYTPLAAQIYFQETVCTFKCFVLTDQECRRSRKRREEEREWRYQNESGGGIQCLFFSYKGTNTKTWLSLIAPPAVRC